MTFLSLLSERLMGRQIEIHYRGEIISMKIKNISFAGETVLIYSDHGTSWTFPNDIYFDITG